MSKKRILLNFAALYVLSIPGKITGFFLNRDESRGAKRISNKDIEIESRAWQSFNHAIMMYIKYLLPRYLMQGYVIKSSMTGWHFKDFIRHLEMTLDKSELDALPEKHMESVKQVSDALVKEFSGLDFDVVYRWLASYQYGLFHASLDKPALEKSFADCAIVELGAGIGANAAVHAALTNKEVYIFDIPPVIEVQRITMDAIKRHCSLSPVHYYSDPEELMHEVKGRPYIILSNWAFTEFPMALRTKLEPLIDGALFSSFSCNSTFEGITNLSYFEELKERLDKTMTVSPITWLPMKNHNGVVLQSKSRGG